MAIPGGAAEADAASSSLSATTDTHPRDTRKRKSPGKEDGETTALLIPGLPNDIARECLTRIPSEQLPLAASVCERWKNEIESPEFLDRRKAAGLSQVIVVLTQIVYDTQSSGVDQTSFHFSVFKPLLGPWSILPPPPAISCHLPDRQFYAVAAIRSEMVVLTGSFEFESDIQPNSVHIYSFLSSTWRRGSDMPEPSRVSFGYASDGERMVYVAGGTGGNDQPLKSAMAYDVKMDKWVLMPDMASELEECKGTFYYGKFNVHGPIEQDDKFETVETFDPKRWCWESVQHRVPDFSSDFRTSCRRRTRSRQRLVTLPPSVAALFKPFQVLLLWRSKLMLVGPEETGTPLGKVAAYVLDLNTDSWTRVEIPEMVPGTINCVGGCCLEI